MDRRLGMIEFLSSWIEQIALTVIIVSIVELILPNGRFKKYIKMILGVYIVFSIASPFLDNSKLYEFGNISLDDYIDVDTESSVNQTSMNRRLQELYIEELENDINQKVESYGFEVYKCNIDAELDSESENSRNT